MLEGTQMLDNGKKAKEWDLGRDEVSWMVTDFGGYYGTPEERKI